MKMYYTRNTHWHQEQQQKLMEKYLSMPRGKTTVSIRLKDVGPGTRGMERSGAGDTDWGHCHSAQTCRRWMPLFTCLLVTTGREPYRQIRSQSGGVTYICYPVTLKGRSREGKLSRRQLQERSVKREGRMAELETYDWALGFNGNSQNCHAQSPSLNAPNDCCTLKKNNLLGV